MTRRLVTTIITRTLLVIGALLCLVFGYWIIQIALAPVTVPPPPPARKNVTFDARLDVSKNAQFTELKTIGPIDVDVPQTGRDNPFVPAGQPSIQGAPTQPPTVTSTAGIRGATSTQAAAPTSTTP